MKLPGNLSREQFGSGFAWGVSSSAYQTEGAWNADGKGLSIWDVFSNTRGKIKDGHNGNTACDFYHRYSDDLALLKTLNIPDFRFSLSWSRLLTDGTRTVNQAGIDYYHRLIDRCFELDITPWITIYHWDLPYELHKKGGWTNRDIIGWFSGYVEFCIKHFGNKVNHWIVLNEPMVFTGTGYFLGVHAPGERGLNSFLAAVHHAAMCQAEGGRIIKSMLPDAKAGTTFSCSLIEPYRKSLRDIEAANRMDVLLNRLFVEPLAGLGYPVEDLKMLRRLEPYIKNGDESRLAFAMDFIGIQNYTRELVAHAWFTPLIRAKLINARKRTVETTDMNWEIHPESIYRMLHKFSAYDSFKELIVTENGAAFPDTPDNGRIHDPKRTAYLQNYLARVLQARQDGVNVNGYFVWSFTDNFEWAEGYKPRFGLVYVDFKTQERFIKDSGYWYSNFLQQKKQGYLRAGDSGTNSPVLPA